MKAVNLIPDEQRRGAGGNAGRSGGVAYAVVGVLAGIVVMVAVYSMASSTISTRKAKLAAVQQQITNSQNSNAQLQSFTTLAAERQSAVSTVTDIAQTRFDWAHALNEIARVLPHDVWLETLAGTVSPTTSAGGGGTGVASEPAIEIQGCTTSQDEVATVMTALHQIDGVDQVNLTKSAKSDSPSSSIGSCTVKSGYPAFDLTVSFVLPDGTSATAATAVNGNTPASALSTAPPAAATAAAGTVATGSGGTQG
jgi:Tfp pilus assembly protein PilN